MAKGAGLSYLHCAFTEAAAKDAKAQLVYMRIYDPEGMSPDPKSAREIAIRVEHVHKELPPERVDNQGNVIDVDFEFGLEAEEEL